MTIAKSDISRIDKDKMWDYLIRFPVHWQEAVEFSRNVDWALDSKKIRNICMAGMGGSAIGADLMAAYSVLCEPVVSALEHMGVRVSFATDQQPAMYEPACYLRDIHPAHDLVTTTPAGELKISGNAQHRVRDAVIQHGSLVYLHRPDRHLACFTDCPVDARAYGTRVASIEDQGAVDREAAIAHLEDALIEWSGATPGAWTEAERARARDVVQETFGNPDWVQHRVDSRAHA